MRCSACLCLNPGRQPSPCPSFLRPVLTASIRTAACPSWAIVLTPSPQCQADLHPSPMECIRPHWHATTVLSDCFLPWVSLSTLGPEIRPERRQQCCREPWLELLPPLSLSFFSLPTSPSYLFACTTPPAAPRTAYLLPPSTPARLETQPGLQR